MSKYELHEIDQKSWNTANIAAPSDDGLRICATSVKMSEHEWSERWEYQVMLDLEY
jgi:hypothetical protein